MTDHRATDGNAPSRASRLSPETRVVIAMVLYALVYSTFCILRCASTYLGDPDYGLFDQSFWTTVKHGLLFHNTYEGGSHFRIHNSPIFFLLVPFYALVPRLETLLVLQTLAVALGAWAVFLLARHFLDAEAGFTCAVVYLLYHPLHGVNYDQFNELSFAVAPLLFAFYYLFKGRMSLYWLSLSLFLATKEDMSFVVFMVGLYVLSLAFLSRRLPRQAREPSPARLALHGLATCALGLFWLWFSLQVVFPYFRGNEPWPYFRTYYGHLGNTMSEAVRTLVLHPQVAFPYVFSKGVVLLFFELLVPLALLPLLSPTLLLCVVPTWLVLTLSAFGGTHNAGSRYMAPIVSILFVAFILGARRLARRPAPPVLPLPSAACSESPSDPPDALTTAIIPPDPARIARVLRWPLVLTILLTLAINTTPLRFPFKNIPRVSAHVRERARLVALIPPEASVSTQADLFSQVTHRLHAYLGYHPDVDYILVDPTVPLWYNHSHWDRDLPELRSSGRYRIIAEASGALLLQRAAPLPTQVPSTRI